MEPSQQLLHWKPLFEAPAHPKEPFGWLLPASQHCSYYLLPTIEHLLPPTPYLLPPTSSLLPTTSNGNDNDTDSNRISHAGGEGRVAPNGLGGAAGAAGPRHAPSASGPIASADPSRASAGRLDVRRPCGISSRSPSHRRTTRVAPNSFRGQSALPGT